MVHPGAYCRGSQGLYHFSFLIETFRLIRDTAFDTSELEKERDGLTEELNVVAGLIQDGIYQNALSHRTRMTTAKNTTS